MLLPACILKTEKTASFQGQCVGKGDTVTFGQYPQATETPEPIEWIVLDYDAANDKMLLLSKYVIDGKPYDTKRRQTWDKCSLRNWLNHEFLNAVFSSSEQVSIQTTHLQNPGSWATEGGAETDDKIFLLSPDEAKRYFRKDATRVAKATTYAIHNGPVVNEDSTLDKQICESDANVQCSATWWLRAPGSCGWEGDHSDCAAKIEKNGEIEGGGETLREEKGVRPALWVHAQACARNSEPTAAAVPAAAPAVEPPAPAPAAPAAHLPSAENCDGPDFMGQCAAKGNTVTFGKYPQATETPDPIEWIVLDIDSQNGKMLLLSKYVLDAWYSDNFNYKCESGTWEESPLRSWLNDVFLKEAFNSSEQASIPMISLENPNNPNGTNGGNETNDKVFLLSIAEANRYFQGNADRKVKATSKAIRNYVWVSAALNTVDEDEKMSERCTNAQCEAVWWLRSPGYDDASAAAVRSGGDIDIYGSNICYKTRKQIYENTRIPGIRPALWVNYAVSPDAAEPSNTILPILNRLTLSALGDYSPTSTHHQGWSACKADPNRPLMLQHLMLLGRSYQITI